jgi:DNA-binding response OmpR family regulator
VAASTEPRARIIIAEDNPILRQGLDRALSASGYTVATAPNGEAVLQMLEDETASPDLLLLDVMMPGISGFDVLRRLQAQPGRRDLPVVMITAATDDALRVAARQEGAADLLIKPFRLGELLERIETHVQRGRQRHGERGDFSPRHLSQVPREGFA